MVQYFNTSDSSNGLAAQNINFNLRVNGKNQARLDLLGSEILPVKSGLEKLILMSLVTSLKMLLAKILLVMLRLVSRVMLERVRTLFHTQLTTSRTRVCSDTIKCLL